ncbi:MAG: hypothetical protein AB7J32_21010 [Pseudonocardia sp.]
MPSASGRVPAAAAPVVAGAGPAAVAGPVASAAGLAAAGAEPGAGQAAPPARRGLLRGRRGAPVRPAHPVRTLAVAFTLSTALAGGLAFANHQVRSTPSASNTALADVGATADVASQLGSALETVYSYDFTRLDENERLARGVITPEFAERFGQLFAQVRLLAPQQRAVVSATVTTSAVQSIEGDRAVLVAFLDQEATRARPGAEPSQLSAAGRLTVVGKRDGDTWKIAEVVNR